MDTRNRFLICLCNRIGSFITISTKKQYGGITLKKLIFFLILSTTISPLSLFAQENTENVKEIEADIIIKNPDKEDQDNATRIKEIEALISELEAELKLLNVEENTTNKPDSLNLKTYGKRTNPVPLGEYIEVKDTGYGDDGSFDVSLNLKIDSIIRGQEAYDILISENQFNDEAPDGLEWAIFNLNTDYVQGSEDYPYTPYFRIVIFNKSGKQVDQSTFGTLKVKFRDTDIFPGITHEGREVYLVPENESFLISLNGKNTIFFKVE